MPAPSCLGAPVPSAAWTALSGGLTAAAPWRRRPRLPRRHPRRLPLPRCPHRLLPPPPAGRPAREEAQSDKPGSMAASACSHKLGSLPSLPHASMPHGHGSGGLSTGSPAAHLLECLLHRVVQCPLRLVLCMGDGWATAAVRAAALLKTRRGEMGCTGGAASPWPRPTSACVSAPSGASAWMRGACGSDISKAMPRGRPPARCWRQEGAGRAGVSGGGGGEEWQRRPSTRDRAPRLAAVRCRSAPGISERVCSRAGAVGERGRPPGAAPDAAGALAMQWKRRSGVQAPLHLQAAHARCRSCPSLILGPAPC